MNVDPKIQFVVAASLAFYGGFIYRWRNYIQSDESNVAIEKKFFVLPSSVQILIATNEAEIEEAMEVLLKDLSIEKTKLVGFDTEWKPRRGDSPLALMQIATRNVCVLIRLCNVLSLPQSVKELFEKELIVKAGVGIATDARLLWTQFNIQTRGCVDLQPIAHKYGLTEGGSGLKALSKAVLNVKINKSHHIRCGNWEADQLTDDQIQYGATDAWIGQEILRRLYENYSPPGENITIYEFCKDVMDVVFNRAFSNKPKSKDNNNNTILEKPKHLKIPKRKTALYENCVMLAPDGEHLCSVNRKKVKWYLDRNLADLVQEEPNIIIKLKHNPNGRGHAGSLYYLSKKENKCVVCGDDESYLRFSIIPHSYRKFLPPNVKGYSSHDIVLLCQKCHRTASIASDSFRKLLTKEDRISHSKLWRIDPVLRDIRSAACALKKSKESIPQNRIEELFDILRNYFNKQEITEEDINNASKIVFKFKNEDSECTEERIIKQLLTKEDMEIFVKRWRKHFIDTMMPKHLPIGWSVDHPVFVD